MRASHVLTALIALLFAIPLGFLTYTATLAESDVWQAFVERAALKVLWQTYGYGAIVAALATLIGGTWGYLTATYDFPARRLFLWLLPAPLAIPVYVYAFVYLAVWNEWMGHSRPVWLFIMLFSLASSPYAYLLSFQAFSREPRDLREQAAVIGLTPLHYFTQVRWPLARPLLLSAFFVVLTEFVADFGAAEMFGLTTFSTSIYKIWSAYMSFGTASLVALLLLVSVAILLWLQSQFNQFSFPSREVKQIKLSPAAGYALTIAAFLQTLLAFIAPVLWLLFLSLSSQEAVSPFANIWPALKTTSLLAAGFSFLLTLTVALILFLISRKARLFPAFLQFGYALPGTLLAISVAAPFYYLQRFFPAALAGSVGAVLLLFLAWSVRFLKVAWEPMTKNRHQLPANLEEAAIIYEENFFLRWRRLLFPLIRTGMLSAFLFTFLETAKELPIALLTRPLGMDTLSIKTFEYTAESQWELAAAPALMISLLGTLGLWILIRGDKKSA